MSSPRNAGFTLIELMIVVVVIAILAAVGYPSYTRWIAEARRTDATIALQRIAATQERFMTECGEYTDDFGGVISDPIPANRCTGLGLGGLADGTTTYTTDDGHYSIEATLFPGGIGGLADNQRFQLEATPVGSQATADGSRCATFTLTSEGVKNATGSDSTKCWKK
ncbi:MAG TPA: type IV pilin protein [Acidiferrobacterales bacterium]|jgi:type IV pilus assembly protein PilE